MREMEILVVIVLTGLFLITESVDAKPECPGHPSCKDDSGDGGGDPPVDSNPTIVYTATQSRGRADLKLANADGSARTTLIEGAKGSGNSPTLRYEYGSWSPDGLEVAFNEGGHGKRLLKLLADGTGSITELYNGDNDPGSSNATPWGQSDWHPGGNYIAFGVSEDRVIDGRNIGDFDVRIVDLSDNSVTNLTSQFDDTPAADSQNAAAEWEPDWSPLGDRLAFVRAHFRDTGNSYEIHNCDFDDTSGPALTCDISSPWREALRLFSPAWHPSTAESRIAYLESDGLIGGNQTRADLFIESPDDSSCIHIKANDSPYGAGTRGSCVVHEIGAFKFGNEVAWSCDGNDLLVGGIDPNTNDSGVYLIADVLTASSISPPAALILPDGGETNTWHASSRNGCP